MIGSFIEKAKSMLSYQEDCDLDQSQNRIWFEEMVKIEPGLSMTLLQTLAFKLGDIDQFAAQLMIKLYLLHLNSTGIAIFKKVYEESKPT